MADLMRQRESDAPDADLTMAPEAAVKSNGASMRTDIGLRVHEARFPIEIEVDIGKLRPKSLQQSFRSTQGPRPLRLARPVSGK